MPTSPSRVERRPRTLNPVYHVPVPNLSRFTRRPQAHAHARPTSPLRALVTITLVAAALVLVLIPGTTPPKRAAIAHATAPTSNLHDATAQHYRRYIGYNHRVQSTPVPLPATIPPAPALLTSFTSSGPAPASWVLVAHVIEADFPAAVWNQAAAVAWCESGYDANAVSPPNTNGTYDHGLFQINDGGTLQSLLSQTGHDPQDLTLAADPAWNAQAAGILYAQRGWEPWTCAAKAQIVAGLYSSAPGPNATGPMPAQYLPAGFPVLAPGVPLPPLTPAPPTTTTTVPSSTTTTSSTAPTSPTTTTPDTTTTTRPNTSTTTTTTAPSPTTTQPPSATTATTQPALVLPPDTQPTIP